eukprot:500302-Prorocentrum_minimum.AAC.1
MPSRSPYKNRSPHRTAPHLPLRVYALYPHAIGSPYGHMLSALTRLAPATGEAAAAMTALAAGR